MCAEPFSIALNAKHVKLQLLNMAKKIKRTSKKTFVRRSVGCEQQFEFQASVISSEPYASHMLAAATFSAVKSDPEAKEVNLCKNEDVSKNLSFIKSLNSSQAKKSASCKMFHS